MPRSSRYPTRSSSSRSYSVVQNERRSERARNDRVMLNQSINDIGRSSSQHPLHPPLRSFHPSHQTVPPQSYHHHHNNIAVQNVSLASMVPMNQYYSMPVLGQMPFVKRYPDVTFCKLNSHEEIKVLIKPRPISGNETNSMFLVNDISDYLPIDTNRIFLRFCKRSSVKPEQMDCLPKSFNLIINNSAFQVKNKYTFAPYDITQRIVCEKSNEIYIKISLEQNEAFDDYYYGVFLVRKKDHRRLLETFKRKEPFDINFSIELVKRKLKTDDDDDLGIIGNLITVSLHCPLSSTRIRIPVRSKQCDHIHCFDVESFIKINEITPRWKCPFCTNFIKLEDIIVDGLFYKILKESSPNKKEAFIFPDGSFKFEKESRLKITIKNDKGNKRSSTCVISTEKKAKTEKEIEIITIDDDDDDDDDDSTQQNGDKDSTTSESSDETIISHNSDYIDESDDDIQIVYEKINKNPSPPSTSNSSSSMNNCSNLLTPTVPTPSASVAPAPPQYNSQCSNTLSTIHHHPSKQFLSSHYSENILKDSLESTANHRTTQFNSHYSTNNVGHKSHYYGMQSQADNCKFSNPSTYNGNSILKYPENILLPNLHQTNNIPSSSACSQNSSAHLAGASTSNHYLNSNNYMAHNNNTSCYYPSNTRSSTATSLLSKTSIANLPADLSSICPMKIDPQSGEFSDIEYDWFSIKSPTTANNYNSFLKQPKTSYRSSQSTPLPDDISSFFSQNN